MKHPSKKLLNRRSFFRGAGGAAAATAASTFWAEETLDAATQNVNTASKPSELKITDIRSATIVRAPMRDPLIRIDTNQGIYGIGEVRDGASKNYALMLKSRLLGENPCDVDKIFRKIKQFGSHGRQGGGVCGVEMALWDLAGKAYNVPAYQLLGGRYRDKVRLYADTPEGENEADFAQKVNVRMVEQGFTFMKMDFGIELLKGIPGTTVNSNYWDIGRQWSNEAMTYGGTEHPFTQVQITDKGLELMTQRIAFVREKIGYEIPLASDHYGHFDHNNAIRLGRAVEKYRLAWLEDLIPWKFTDQWKTISDAIETPTLTGEDIYLKEDFIKLIDARAIDMVHPDLATSGG